MKKNKKRPHLHSHAIDEFTGLIPDQVIREVLTKREYDHFAKYMQGQTGAILDSPHVVYRSDLESFLRQLACGIRGKDMYVGD